MKDDVVVVGGGPAGATVAGLLASAGHRVTVFEREQFPRPHIGESLLPLAAGAFERLGVDTEKPCFLRKDGAQFHDEARDETQTFPFAEGLPGSRPGAWQVDRPAFDAMMLERAGVLGARVQMGCAVESIEFGAETVRLRTTQGETLARYCIDATGQHALLARKSRVVNPLRGLGRAAVWVHYDNMRPEAYRELTETGNIRILFMPNIDGWAWLIPLPGGRLSAGVVSRRQGIDRELYGATLGRSALLRRLVGGAASTQPSVIGNFSFRNSEPFGPRYACIGDASCFLDPVFSSGVSMALESAVQLADIVSPALDDGRESDPALCDPLDRRLKVGYQRFTDLIRLFYDSKLIYHLVFAERPTPELRAGLISMLAGDVWNDANPFLVMIQRSRRLRNART